MKKSIDEFKKLFLKVKAQGFIETHRKGNTGIGKTFEDCCCIVENNFDEADFKGIEIKSQRAYTGSYLTLFTKAPTWPQSANTLLRERYGTPDKEYDDVKVLHTSIFADQFNTHKSGYGFKIKIDRINEKILLLVKNLKEEKIVSDEIYWSFEVIRNVIEKKLQYLAYITAKVKNENNKEFFHFTSMIILKGLTFDKFLNLFEDGYIMFDVRIGAYKSGKNAGKTHDHGSGFRLSKNYLDLAFEREEV